MAKTRFKRYVEVIELLGGRGFKDTDVRKP